jgi:hypothetical protein
MGGPGYRSLRPGGLPAASEGYLVAVTTPDPDADFVDQVLAAAHRLLAAGTPEVTDLRVADESGLQLATVRAVLAAEDGKRVTVDRHGAEAAWRVTDAEPLEP